MRCQAFLDYGKDNEGLCSKPNAKICDMCGHWFCDEHANVMDGDSAKYHTHFICWASRIFQMFKRKKDIPKPVLGVCLRCKSLGDKMSLETDLFLVDNKKFKNVCGLCKSELLDEAQRNSPSVVMK